MHKQFGDQFSSKLFNTKLKKSTTILPKLLHIYNTSYVEELGAKYQQYCELYKLFIMHPLMGVEIYTSANSRLSKTSLK
jgi:hypothetical protein